jgi:hypothetical protein
MRAAFVLVLALAGCKSDAVRDMVENDKDGSPLAVAACFDRPDLPADACKRVATRRIDSVLAMAAPNDLQCWDATRAAQKFAPDKVDALKTKCRAHQ